MKGRTDSYFYNNRLNFVDVKMSKLADAKTFLTSAAKRLNFFKL